MADTVAASMGKLVRPKERANAKPEDIARGILDSVTNNVVCSLQIVSSVPPRVAKLRNSASVCFQFQQKFTPSQGSLAMLHARTQKVKHVLFAGNFLRHNPISSKLAFYLSQFISCPSFPSLNLKYFVFVLLPTFANVVARLTYAFEYWSKGAMNAIFLKHEGYLGAIGAMLYGAMHDTHPTLLASV